MIISEFQSKVPKARRVLHANGERLGHLHASLHPLAAPWPARHYGENQHLATVSIIPFVKKYIFKCLNRNI